MGADYKHERAHTYMGGSSGNLGVGGADQYVCFSGKNAVAAVEDQITEVITRAGIFRNARAYLNVAPGGVASRTFVLRVNGNDTAITITITGAAQQGVDIVNIVAVVPGDLVCWRSDGGVGAPAASRCANSTDFVRI